MYPAHAASAALSFLGINGQRTMLMESKKKHPAPKASTAGTSLSVVIIEKKKNKKKRSNVH